MLPASAGMVPRCAGCSTRPRCAPRQRGDGPGWTAWLYPYTGCSPPARGWSPARRGRRATISVLPASAGMVPGCRWSASGTSRAPRQRGDGPLCGSVTIRIGSCSPPARGWSRPRGPRCRRCCVLPASAGMVPTPRRPPPAPPRAPRQRGDGPIEVRVQTVDRACSPPARGWSLPARVRAGWLHVLPASAGMVPPGMHSHRSATGAPRQRGDGPNTSGRPWVHPLRSPPARGWSPEFETANASRPVLPASAGMVPGGAHHARPPLGAPRQRGDGPLRVGEAVGREVCSPPARGWSLSMSSSVRSAAVLPASAGMVPSSGRTAGKW